MMGSLPKRITAALGTAASGALDLLYPRTCAGCGAAPAGDGMHLCWQCLADAVYIKDPFCSVCGDAIEGAVSHSFKCSWCRRTDPAFNLARSAVRFRGNMKTILHAFKYENGCHLETDLAGLLAGCVMGHYGDICFDGISFVPLYPRKKRERSYNQSQLLARGLGRRIKLPVFDRSLTRVRSTKTQTRLNAEERKENVRGAFVASMPEWTSGRRILLVDDVMTTGATVNECARVLMNSEALSVHVVTVARG